MWVSSATAKFKGETPADCSGIRLRLQHSVLTFPFYTFSFKFLLIFFFVFRLCQYFNQCSLLYVFWKENHRQEPFPLPLTLFKSSSCSVPQSMAGTQQLPSGVTDKQVRSRKELKNLLKKEKTNRRACNHVGKARIVISEQLILYFSNPWVYSER